VSAILEMIELVRYGNTVSPTIRDAATSEFDHLLRVNADRIVELEDALKSIIYHFSVSSVAWRVVYDQEITVKELRKYVETTGLIPSFPEEPPIGALRREST
jgi:hypothetical protein